MSDKPWREMEAGRELDCLIAEALGWKNIEQYRDGEWLGGDPVDDYGLQPVPFHSANPAVALRLPIGEGAQIELIILWTGKALARIPLNISSRLAEASPDYEQAESPALAVCRAWLAYRERMARYA